MSILVYRSCIALRVHSCNKRYLCAQVNLNIPFHFSLTVTFEVHLSAYRLIMVGQCSNYHVHVTNKPVDSCS